ncbi:MAG: macro domain-containing protein [Enterococcus sp.]|nr:macro domain-containing protein [Enterococcus sp.]
MITYKEGDIFTTDMPAIGHGVNCKGVMGSGIAVTVRKLYPDVYKAYAQYCRTPGLNGGDVFIMKSEVDGKYIFNMASQVKMGKNATYDLLEASLWAAFDGLEELELSGLALPQIGCGIGGLEWAKARPMIEEVAASYPLIDVELWTFNPRK